MRVREQSFQEHGEERGGEGGRGVVVGGRGLIDDEKIKHAVDVECIDANIMTACEEKGMSSKATSLAVLTAIADSSIPSLIIEALLSHPDDCVVVNCLYCSFSNVFPVLPLSVHTPLPM